MDPVIYDDVEQGSPEWFELRRGIPTASMFKVLMVKNEAQKGRLTYMHKLAGERITETTATSFVNADMERGKEMEPLIRRHYSFVRDCDPHEVAFVRNGKFGASPDALIGDDGLLEIKSAEPHILIPMLLKAKQDPNYFPPEHKAQCQGSLMATGREWIDLVVYSHPKLLLITRATRDEDYIQELRDEVDLFDLELRRLVERLK